MQQIKAKALPIVEALYPGYKLLFMFDNAISNAIYAKNKLQVMYMNKVLESQQLFLQGWWYKATNEEIVTQKMYLLTKNPIINKLTNV